MQELPIIQKTYDLIKWYIPIINRLPRDHKYSLGDRIVTQLYDILELLISARFNPQRLSILQSTNLKLDLLKYQSRLLFDFNLINIERYEYVNQILIDLGKELGGWIKQQQ
jgi:hypothetical protein